MSESPEARRRQARSAQVVTEPFHIGQLPLLLVHYHPAFQIAVNEMTDEDFVFVLEKALRGSFGKDTIHNMVEVNKRVATSQIREGGPFEFNLRDLLRWSEAAARVREPVCLREMLDFSSTISPLPTSSRTCHVVVIKKKG